MTKPDHHSQALDLCRARRRFLLPARNRRISGATLLFVPRCSHVMLSDLRPGDLRAREGAGGAYVDDFARARSEQQTAQVV